MMKGECPHVPRCEKLTTGGDMSIGTCVLNHGLADIKIAGFTAVNDVCEANNFNVLMTLVEDTGTVTFVSVCGKVPTSVRSELIENAAQSCHLEQCDILYHDIGPSSQVLADVLPLPCPLLRCCCPAGALQAWHGIVSCVCR